MGPDFRHIDTWIFDLDNTLYHADTDVFAQVDQRMTAFIGELLDLDPVAARKVQKDYLHAHGTTLSGLMQEHGMAPEPFLSFVHDIDVSMLRPDRALGAVLAALPGKRFIYTNGSVSHAENVLAQLEITSVFHDIFDIHAAGYVPKPRIEPYERLVARGAFDPGCAAMFEDIHRNLKAPHTLGMTTVWVRSAIPDDGPGDGETHTHVHHQTDNLLGFLDALQTKLS